MNIYPLTIYYDESCPLCKLEIDNLKARNDKQLLQFVDVSGTDFKDEHAPASQEAMMEIIHARRADGEVISGVEVFRLAYGAVGLGWLTAPTKLPIVKSFCDWLYPHIARNRYRLSDRFSGVLFKIARDRAIRRQANRAVQQSKACHEGHCER
jgi:predicted DCC family thiol-disulfide oxidoreductase YuxK